MKNKTLLTLCAAPLLLSVNSMAEVLSQGAFTLDKNGDVSVKTDQSDCYTLNINDNYSGTNAFGNWVTPGENVVDCVTRITYNREFTKDIPATVVFPVTVPEGIATNASFYALQYVIPDLRDGKRTWLAKMKKIEGRDVRSNEPVAVIVNENGPITFGNLGHIQYQIGPETYNTDYTFGQYDAKEKPVITYNVNYNGELYDEGVTYPVDDNKNQWYFIGNYNNGTYSNEDPEVGLCYGFEGSNYNGGVHKGQFGKIVIGTEKKAFRSLLCKANADVHLPLAKQSANGANMFSLPESINVEFVDTDANGKEHTTYVGKLNRMDKILQNRERSTFDLKGRNVDGKKTAKGVYLKK